MSNVLKVIALVSDQKKIVTMMKKPEIFDLTMMRSGSAIVSLVLRESGKYEVPPLLCNENFRINVNEGKDAEKFVTVVCDTNGMPIRPFWVKGKRNQREIDHDVDVRFSLDREFCFISLNKNCLLIVTKVTMKDYYGYVQLKTQELFSTVLKRNGGKFLFNENIFPVRSPLNCFREPVRVAIKKGNLPDGGGPLYFEQRDPAEVVSKEVGSSTLSVLKTDHTILLHGGVSTVISEQTS